MRAPDTRHDALPDGYDTIVDNGTATSTGETQLPTNARAFLAKPTIRILVTRYRGT